EEKKMSLILGLIQFIIILLITLFEYHIGSLSVFLWATLLLLFGLPHLIEGATGIFTYSSIVFNKASLFVILFSLIYLLMKHFYYHFYFNNRDKQNAVLKGSGVNLEINEKLEKSHINKRFIIYIFIF